MKKFPLIAAFLVLAYGVQALGQGSIIYTDGSGQGTQTDFAGNLGLDFTVNEGITVDALGVFNASGSGTITGTIYVGIYDFATPGVVATATFNGYYAPQGLGYDVFQSITPVYLAPGNYQVDAVGFSSSDPNGNQYSGSTGPTTNDLGGALSFTGAGYINSAGLVYPGPGNCGGCSPLLPLPGQASQFDAGTFEAHVPEGGASSLYLLLAGLVCFGAVFVSRNQLASRA